MVLLVPDLAAVGDVHRRHPHAVAGRGDEAGLVVGRSAVAEAGDGVVEADPAGDRHAVPAALPVVDAGVAAAVEVERREGGVGHLRLLEAEDVGLRVSSHSQMRTRRSAVSELTFQVAMRTKAESSEARGNDERCASPRRWRTKPFVNAATVSRRWLIASALLGCTPTAWRWPSWSRPSWPQPSWSELFLVALFLAASVDAGGLPARALAGVFLAAVALAGAFLAVAPRRAGAFVAAAFFVAVRFVRGLVRPPPSPSWPRVPWPAPAPGSRRADECLDDLLLAPADGCTGRDLARSPGRARSMPRRAGRWRSPRTVASRPG